MDRTDKLINNRALIFHILFYVIMLGVSVLAGFVISELMAEKLTRIQLEAVLSGMGKTSQDSFSGLTKLPLSEDIAVGEELLKNYGIDRNSNPRLFECFYDIRNNIWLILSLSLSAVSTLWLIVSVKHISSIYDNLELMRLECIRISELMENNHTTVGDDFSCERRLSDSIALISQRMIYLTDNLKNEKNNLKEFLSDFSHQLKTSLAVLRLNNDMLTEIDNLSEDKRQSLYAETHSQLCSMENLIKSALKLAKLNADAVEYKMERASVYDTCRMAVKKITPLLEEKSIGISLSCDCDTEISHDNVWLCEAFENIIKNAYDHAECSEITVSLESNPISVTVSIADNGVGIPQDEIPVVFERFSSRNRDISMNCTGLGMSVARKIIQAHNGEILVFSEKDNGTRFEIIFLK